MLGRTWLLLPLAAAYAAACSSDDARPAAAGVGAQSAAGKASTTGGRNQTGTGGAPSEAEGGVGQGEGGAALGGDANIGHLGGLGPANSAGGVSNQPAVCDVATTWGNPQGLTGLSSAGVDERLLSMTHDELSVVFTSDGALMRADRASADADFAAPSSLILPSGFTHEHGLSLSSDGLRLVVVSDSGDALAELSRATRTASFGDAPSKTRYVALNYDAVQFGAYLASPVLSHDDASLYFVRLVGDASQAYRAQGDAGFAVPDMSEDMITLGGLDGDAKLTLSVTADERALFIFDEALGHVTGLWSAAPGAPFTEAAQFPGLQSLFTNQDCSRVYGTLADGAELDIVIQTPN